MEQGILTLLPNLSIGVVSIIALGYVTKNFLMHLDERSKAHQEAMAVISTRHHEAMNERENAIRAVEREVRTTLLGQLNKNTEVMNDTTRALERVVTVLDKT